MTDLSGMRPISSTRVQLFVQFMAFSVIGVLGTVVHYLILIVMVSGARVLPVIATSVGAACGAMTNYILNYRLTFRSRKRHSETFGKFLAVAGFGVVINAVIVEAVVRYLGWHYLVAQVIATGVVLFWGFTANRFWTFKGDGDENR